MSIRLVLRSAATALRRPAARAVARPFVLASRPMSTATASATSTKIPDMFCFQCEQTRDNTGCTTIGVCGKTPETAALQDLLIHCVKGVSQYAAAARALGPHYVDKDVDVFVLVALFSTVTNVNFDSDRIIEYTKQAQALKAKAKAIYQRACAETKTPEAKLTGPASFEFGFGSTEQLHELGKTVGLLARKQNLSADAHGLIEMIVYGLKGTAAYAEHAHALGKFDNDTVGQFHSILAKISDEKSTEASLWETAMAVGKLNLKVMEMLDGGHTNRFGAPVPTEVSTTPVEGKALLVSGHDMNDLENMLKQTEGKGINVYTHGEMLPAHGYPGLKKYKHLVGHFGGPWQLQKLEFASFPGPIVMTTNCIIEPRKSYKSRIFTRSVTGWPGVAHIEDQDYSRVVESALKEKGFVGAQPASKPLTTGFGHGAIMSVSDKIIAAIKTGDIKNFFVIGGCDGTEGERSYFTDVATAAPKDSVILTMGCGKYRFNRLDFGNIGGIPRMLDMGQCNDAYSGIQVALALSKALNVSVNDLPLHFAVSWFEQKAVAVLLTLLSLNVQRIRLGPNLPAFATPGILAVLQRDFKIQGISTPGAEDVKKMMAHN